MGQNRLESFIEANTNTFIGLIGSWLITWGVMSWSTYPPMTTASIAAVLCTIWSLVRGYYIRRYFVRKANERADALYRRPDGCSGRG
jgi:hypothetical protein